MNIFILFTHFVHIIFTFLQASVHIIWWSLHIIYPSWEDPFTLFTHSARICSHYLFILQGSVHTIYSSCKDMFIICINLAIIYPSCKDIFTLFTPLARICSLYLSILRGPVYINYSFCNDIFTMLTYLASNCSHFLLILQGSVSHYLFISQGPVHTFTDLATHTASSHFV